HGKPAYCSSKVVPEFWQPIPKSFPGKRKLNCDTWESRFAPPTSSPALSPVQFGRATKEFPPRWFYGPRALPLHRSAESWVFPSTALAACSSSPTSAFRDTRKYL